MLRSRAVGRTAPSLAWPVAVPLVGLPVWWLLGGWQFVVLAMTVPMPVLPPFPPSPPDRPRPVGAGA